MTRHQLGFVVTVAALAGMSALVAAQGPYAPPRTPWGDPDLQGAYNNSNESRHRRSSGRRELDGPSGCDDVPAGTSSRG